MAYFEGWGEADTGLILKACAPGYVLDDPDAGEITEDSLDEFVAQLRSTVPGGAAPFVTNRDILADADWSTVSCWWEVPGTGLCGSGLLKISDEGVLSERVAYYSKQHIMP